MRFGEVPSAFMRFGNYYIDFDMRPLKGLAPAAFWEKVLQDALATLDAGRKRVLADFLDQCLDGTKSEDDLLRLWKRTGARTSIEPVSRFFRDVRSRLRALGFE